ncbi:hypothetical protein [uncultured Sphingomonas sp.]|uniref:hypothetical protein n=1 Tax=uncultured Sphingomonas sp. TaxID=158754 RepID=UPI0026154329|nr:hypothetical protein [uncultured Sphingomonas sp.]
MRKLGVLPSGWLGTIVSDDAADPRPFLVPGVRVRFDPVSRKAVRDARAACAAVLQEAEGDFQEASDALTREMVRHGIAEWEGVGDVEGEIAPVNAETIALFIADTDLCEAAEAVYVQPWLLRDTEKNGSAASSLGTSGAETAVSDTATTPANGAKTVDASPTPKAKPKKRGKAASTSPAS